MARVSDFFSSFFQKNPSLKKSVSFFFFFWAGGGGGGEGKGGLASVNEFVLQRIQI